MIGFLSSGSEISFGSRNKSFEARGFIFWKQMLHLCLYTKCNLRCALCKIDLKKKQSGKGQLSKMKMNLQNSIFNIQSLQGNLENALCIMQCMFPSRAATLCLRQTVTMLPSRFARRWTGTCARVCPRKPVLAYLYTNKYQRKFA